MTPRPAHPPGALGPVVADIGQALGSHDRQRYVMSIRGFFGREEVAG